MEEKQPALLKKAEECFLNARDRNKADFKNYEKLSTVYNLLNRTQDAYDWALKATKRYPGSARLRLNIAKIAEQLAKTELAVKHYKEAIDIEDKYRRQFQEMYPEEELISRLGQDKYKFAKERIKSLSRQSSP
jgi:tetratricopeptide (TPR) repeat protein